MPNHQNYTKVRLEIICNSQNIKYFENDCIYLSCHVCYSIYSILGKFSARTAAQNKLFLVYSTQFFVHTLLVLVALELTIEKNAK